MKNYFENWREKLSELEDYFELKEDQLEEAFETQKNKFAESLKELKTKVDGMADSEKAQQLKAKMEALQVQLALGKAESRDAFEAQQKNLKHAVHQLGESMKSTKEKADQQLEEAGTEFSNLSEKFQTSMDVLRLQYSLGKAELKDQWESQSKELKAKLTEAKSKAEALEEAAEEKLEAAGEDLKEAYSKFTDSLGKLFS